MHEQWKLQYSDQKILGSWDLHPTLFLSWMSVGDGKMHIDDKLQHFDGIKWIKTGIMSFLLFFRMNVPKFSTFVVIRGKM